MLCFRRRCCFWHNTDLNMKPKTLTTYVSCSTYAFLIDVGFLQHKNGATALTLDQMPAERSLPDCLCLRPGDPLGSASLRLNRRLHNPASDSVQHVSLTGVEPETCVSVCVPVSSHLLHTEYQKDSLWVKTWF